MDAEPRRLAESDFDREPALLSGLLTLNALNETELSPLDGPGLRRLVRQSALTLRIGTGDALLIVLDQTADYDSPNFQWFKARYGDFLYIDRVVVARHARGQGCARRLYAALFDVAGRLQARRIVCEVNLDPPNPASDAFHRAMGFLEVGRGEVPGAGKTVRYLMRTLVADGAYGG